MPARSRIAAISGGASLVRNGEFDSSASWSISGAGSIADGKATVGATSTLNQTVTVIEGQRYRLLYTLTIRAGAVTPSLAGGSSVNGTTRSASGRYSEYIRASAGNTTLRFTTGASADVDIDSVSLRAG